MSSLASSWKEKGRSRVRGQRKRSVEEKEKEEEKKEGRRVWPMSKWWFLWPFFEGAIVRLSGIQGKREKNRFSLSLSPSFSFSLSLSSSPCVSPPVHGSFFQREPDRLSLPFLSGETTFPA